MNPFLLQTRWTKLVMINYQVQPGILLPYVPAKTELDLFNNEAYLSVVGFMFEDAHIKGIRFPFLNTFPEINLRFYVKGFVNGQLQKGVSFIREFVANPLIAYTGNLLYREHFGVKKVRMSYNSGQNSFSIKYSCKKDFFKITASKTKHGIRPDTEESFICDNYYAFNKQNNSKTSYFAIQHPAWKIHELTDFSIQIDFASLYGKQFMFLNYLSPSSIFCLDGSHVNVPAPKPLLQAIDQFTFSGKFSPERMEVARTFSH